MKRTVLFILCLLAVGILQAQTPTVVSQQVGVPASSDSKPVYIPSRDRYRRSSLYSILVKHPEKEFCEDIVEVCSVLFLFPTNLMTII